jgi:hypothetical protein
MSPYCFLVHGWDKKREYGAGSVDELAPMVKKRGWMVADYNWVTLRRGLLPGPGLIYEEGARLARVSKPGDAAIGHSAGAAIVYLAMCHGAEFRRVILLNPTLNRDVEFPDCDMLESIWVFSSPDDWIPWFASLNPFHLFGKMGKTGYTGKSPKVGNIVKTKTLGNAHTEFFDPDKIDVFGPTIVSCLPLV